MSSLTLAGRSPIRALFLLMLMSALSLAACEPKERSLGNPSHVRITRKLDSSSPEFATGSIFFIGNPTVLIRYGGVTILTDPNFIHKHGQVPLGYGLDTTRLKDPAIEMLDCRLSI